ncbi:hypothetical protein JOM56_009870 [Amanita muscaria]
MHPFSRTAAAQFLPFDIIQEIFAHHSTALWIYSDSDIMPNIAPAFPWLLGHVCASWRTVFLSMHAEFWSSLIMFPNAPLNTVEGKRSLDIVTTFMERTKGLPISLSLQLRHIPRPVIDIFVKHCKQWQHVELIFEQKQLSLLCSIKDQLPLLRSLRLGFSHPTPLLAGPPEEPIVLFENAPLLTHLRLHHPWRWRFHWPSVSTLELHRHIEADTLLEILSQLENLETLLIMQGDRLDTITNLTMPITMTRLKILRAFGSMTLALLTAPSLEVLHIGTCRNQNFSPVCSAFFGRSACRLLELSIGHCYATESLSAILPFVPTIETLYVGCTVKVHENSLQDIFHALACPPGEPLQLPQLHTIRLSILSLITEEDVTALRSMIMLRRLGPHPQLRQILILPCREEFFEVQSRVLTMLEKLVREYEIQGVQIKIKPISYGDFETPFYDGNRHYFDILYLFG